MNTLSKIFIVLVTVVLGGVINNQIRINSERTNWQHLDYFPYPVEDLITLKPFGSEFWIETEDGEIYKIKYPCSKEQTCWEKSNDVPSIPLNGEYVDEDIHEYLFYDKSQGVCIDDFNISPFPGNLKTCITSTAMAESFYVFSLGLDDKQELWIWNNPWESPYSVIERMISAVCWGSVMGLVIGVLLIQISVKKTAKS